MKLLERLTNEEVDEMILETDVDETHCPQPRGRASSSDRRKNRDIPRERILERVVTQIVNMSGHTHKVVENMIKDPQSPAASCELTGCKDLSQDTTLQ